MASRKAKTIVFRLPTEANPSAMNASIEGELRAGVVSVVRELPSKEILLELQSQEHSEQLISYGYSVNEVRVQPSSPTGQFTNVSIMRLRAYIEDDAKINELKKYGDIKSELIRLKYMTGHDLTGIEDCNRLVRMVLTAPSIPYSIKIDGEWCSIIHSNQKPVCTVCHEEGHHRADCPSVVCFNCGEKGHIRAKCSKDEFGWDKDANPAAPEPNLSRSRNKITETQDQAQTTENINST